MGSNIIKLHWLVCSNGGGGECRFECSLRDWNTFLGAIMPILKYNITTLEPFSSHSYCVLCGIQYYSIFYLFSSSYFTIILFILNLIMYFDYALNNTTIALVITCCDGLSSSLVKPCCVLKTIRYECPHHLYHGHVVEWEVHRTIILPWLIISILSNDNNM